MKKFLLFISCLFLLFITSNSYVYAQDWNSIIPNCIVNDVATLACIPAVFQNVVNAALMFAGAVALFFVVYAGIRYVTSRGDPKAVEGARNTLTWAIIGLVIIILAFTIIQLISNFTGVSCFLQIKSDFTNC